jgi:two-component system chemotaxis response regulator CheY
LAERRALVVDDTSIMRMIVGKVLREQHYDVTEATNGAEAIQLFMSTRPHVVILDLNMDPIDGTTALRGILSVDPGARIVVCSSTSDAHVVVNLIKLGARSYITKPFTPDRLMQAVNDALAL